MVAIQENHTESGNNKTRKAKKIKTRSTRINKSKLRRKKNKKNKKSKKGLTNVNIKNPTALINAAEQNLDKSIEEKDPKLVLEEGTRFFDKLTFDTRDENAVSIGKYSVSTKNADKEDVKFIEENLNELTIMALYDAVTVQGKLSINAISESVSQEEHDLIVGSNEREARAQLELGKKFNILREQKELIKEMILAVLKNIFEENEGNSKKGFLGRSWDTIMGNAGTPMKAFVNYIDNNELISELNKLPEDEKAELKYYACLTALQLNDKNSFFNDIPASKFFSKMIGAMSYLPLDPKKVDNEIGKQTVKINSYDKKNCKDLLTWLFKIAGASLPRFKIVPKTEFCLDSTFSPRMLSLVGGGLAIAGAAVGAIGYRGYTNPENKETGFLNKLRVGFNTQAKKDFEGLEKWSKEKAKVAKEYFNPEKEKNPLQKTINYTLEKDRNLTKAEKIALLEKMKEVELNASPEKQERLKKGIETLNAQGIIKDFWYNKNRSSTDKEDKEDN